MSEKDQSLFNWEETPEDKHFGKWLTNNPLCDAQNFLARNRLTLVVNATCEKVTDEFLEMSEYTAIICQQAATCI